MRYTGPVATQMRKGFVRFLKLCFREKAERHILDFSRRRREERGTKKSSKKKRTLNYRSASDASKARTLSVFPLVQLTFLNAGKRGMRDVELLLTQDADLTP